PLIRQVLVASAVWSVPLISTLTRTTVVIVIWTTTLISAWLGTLVMVMVPRVTPFLLNTRVKVPAGRPSSSKVPFPEIVVVIEGFSRTVTVTRLPEGTAIASRPPAEEVLAALWPTAVPCKVTRPLVLQGEVGLLLQPETTRLKNAIRAERRTCLRIMRT